jgi:YD repeat-containing protein
MIKHAIHALILIVTLSLVAPCQAATSVRATSVQPTRIGTVVAGKTYRVTATGVANLCTGCNGGQGLTFTADGKPTAAFAAPYAPFYPNGLDYDPSQGPTAYAVGGPQKLYGMLLGTFTASPQGYGDYFAMGTGFTFVASASGDLYAKINDCCDGDNAGGYEVKLSEVTLVQATSVPPTFLGNVVAGKTYRITATGVANLCTGCNAGQGLTFTANGKPTAAFAAPYAAFFPNGLDYDPSQGPAAYGVGGPQKLYGMLLGTLSASPQGYGDYFAVGDSYVFTASTSAALYVKINDCCDGDNAGSYSVSLAEASEVISYSYDALGRLITVSHAGGDSDGITSSYAFDNAGNRTTVNVSVPQ